MTGPAPGKIPIRIKLEVEGRVLEPEAYIHLKGYSRAFVTHLDIEGIEVRSNVRSSRVIPAGFVGTENGFHVFLVSRFWIEINGIRTQRFTVRGLQILRYGERSGGCVGLKDGGIFLGFRREVIKRLEEIARSIAPEYFQSSRASSRGSQLSSGLQ